jgi:hypothetical protein
MRQVIKRILTIVTLERWVVVMEDEGTNHENTESVVPRSTARSALECNPEPILRHEETKNVKGDAV